MLIYVNVKQAGSRKNALTKEPYEINFESGSLKDLIGVFTSNELIRYQKALETKKHNESLSGKDDRLADIKYKKTLIDPDEAIRTALEGFEDGLVRILQNEAELTNLESEVKVKEGDVFTFIKLTFLAGRMW